MKDEMHPWLAFCLGMIIAFLADGQMFKFFVLTIPVCAYMGFKIWQNENKQ